MRTAMVSTAAGLPNRLEWLLRAFAHTIVGCTQRRRIGYCSMPRSLFEDLGVIAFRVMVCRCG